MEELSREDIALIGVIYDECIRGGVYHWNGGRKPVIDYGYHNRKVRRIIPHEEVAAWKWGQRMYENSRVSVGFKAELNDV